MKLWHMAYVCVCVCVYYAHAPACTGPLFMNETRPATNPNAVSAGRIVRKDRRRDVDINYYQDGHLHTHAQASTAAECSHSAHIPRNWSHKNFNFYTTTQFCSNVRLIRVCKCGTYLCVYVCVCCVPLPALGICSITDRTSVRSNRSQ